MYESPMTRFIYDVQNELNKQEEACIMATIKQTIGYSVDKEELIKALAYDRHQYEKGFEDAKKMVLESIENDTRLGMYSHFQSYKDADEFKKVIENLSMFAAESEVEE